MLELVYAKSIWVYQVQISFWDEMFCLYRRMNWNLLQSSSSNFSWEGQQLSRSNENFDCFAILSAELTSVSHKAALVLKRGCENNLNLLRLTIFIILSIFCSIVARLKSIKSHWVRYSWSFPTYQLPTHEWNQSIVQINQRKKWSKCKVGSNK